ncbi:MAG: hypothetical protein P4L55_23975 [Syntrophobacteraceae bacterium]|nr:hypothetical protein [Syntrophobacteraceae bacterium]
MKKRMVFLILFTALCLSAGTACCQQTGSGLPVFSRGSGPSAIFGDGQHLYVMAGGKILEYKLDGMNLEHSVDLPACAPPEMEHGPQAGAPPFRSMLVPPPPPPHGLWAGDGKLYVLDGPAVYVYKVPGLSLENTVKLPAPKPPQAGK